MRKTAFTLLALGALVALSSCTRGSVGIFASIEQEVKTQKSNLSENSAITGVAESNNHFFASIGNISRRSKSSDNWNGVGNPPGIDSPLSVALVQLGAPDSRSYYAAFNSQEGSDYGLFQLTIDDTNGSVTWSELTLGYSDTSIREIASLLVVDSDADGWNDVLYASVRTNSSNNSPQYVLLRSPGLPGEETISFDVRDPASGNTTTETLVDQMIDAAHRIENTTTWFVGSKGWLYTLPDGGTTGTALTGTSVPGYPQADTVVGKGFSGIVDLQLDSLPGTGDAQTGLFVSDNEGRIWVTPDGGSSWQVSGDRSRAFTDMVWLPQAGSGGAGALLVGTKPIIQEAISDQGYYEVELAATGTEVSFEDFDAPDASAYSTSNLQDATVLSFYRPDDGDRTGKSNSQSFILTGGIGLWNVTYGTDGTPVEVKWE